MIEQVFSEPSWTLFGFGTLTDRKIIQKLKIRDRPTAAKLIETLESKPPKDSQTATKWFEFLADKGGKQVIGTTASIFVNHAFSFLSRRL